MSFLAPLTLIGLLFVALPVLIHLLVRRRAKRLDFPTLRYLRETPSFRLYPRHVRQPLLLALRALALVLLILGFARPFISFNASNHHTRVILIDASLSMHTRGRQEAALAQAREILNKLGAGERAAVIAFSSDVTVLIEATSDRDQLLEALKSYEAVGGMADYGVGLAAATALLKREAPGTSQIDLISDFQESNITAETSALSSHSTVGARIVTYAVGKAAERNAFLTDGGLKRGARTIELAATEIISDREGQRGARRVWSFDTSEGAHSDIDWRTEINGQIVGAAKVNTPDDFDADDNYFFAFAPPLERRALLIETDEGGASLYLRAALEAAAVEETSPIVLDRRREVPHSAVELAPYALVVLTLHGAPRAAEMIALREYASAGGNVWLCLSRDLDTESWNRLASTPEGRALPFVSLTRAANSDVPYSFGAMDMDAPALRALSESAASALRSTRIRQRFLISPRESASVLMRWSDATPAFVSGEVGAEGRGGAVLLLATSPAREASDLGLSPALPALAYSILRAAAQPRDLQARMIGEPVRLGVSPDTLITITNAEGHTRRTTARTLAQHPSGVIRESGIYRVEFAGQMRFMAFNSPAAESSLALATPEVIKSYFDEKESDLNAGQDSWRDAALERRGNLWRFFLCAAFIMLVAELLVSLHQRRKGQMRVDGSGSPAQQS